MLDLYEVLGLDKNATQDEIKHCYRKLIQKYHPDKLMDESEEVKNSAKKRFEQIQEAYNVLIDANRRKLYDETGYVELNSNEIASSVMSVIKSLLIKYLSMGERIFTIDIISEMSEECEKIINVSLTKIKSLKNKKRFLKKVVNKIKKKKKLDKDFLKEILIHEFNAIDNDINSNIDKILIMTNVKQILSNYDFDFMNVIENLNSEEVLKSKEVPLGNIFDMFFNR